MGQFGFKYRDFFGQVLVLLGLYHGQQQIALLAQRARFIDGNATVFQTPSDVECDPHAKQGTQ